MSPYSEIDISNWEYRDQEPTGKNSKDWYRDPDSKQVWLFKPVGDGPNVTQDGKDWAEKLAHEIAVLFGIPTARVEFARREHELGTICLNANPSSLPIQSGALLLQSRDENFDMRDKESRGHSLTVISEVLQDVAVPLGFEGPSSMGGIGIFAGYLILDAIVGNRDRHSQNWSVVLDENRRRRMMPSYDHGSSLGFQLGDELRMLILNDPLRFNAFVNRGTAYRFEGGRHTTLVDMAGIALSLAGDAAKSHWRERVLAVADEQIDSVIGEAIRMSVVTRTFSMKFVAETLRRVRDVVN